MGHRLSVAFDIEEDGYRYEVTALGTPMWLTVEVLLGFLEDLKREYDAAPALNAEDMKAWQSLGRIGPS
jgi:hypothetical protein